MERKTVAELGEMNVRDLVFLHAAYDAQIGEIRAYHADIHDVICAKEHAARKHGPTELTQSISGLGAKSIIDQVMALPAEMLNELREFFKGGK